MTTAIALAGPDQSDRVLSLMARYHEEQQLGFDDAHRDAVVRPLLDGNPLGAIWLIGPSRAPLGYVLMSFGWSSEAGGMIGWLEEVYIRSSVRSRGIGTEAVHAITLSLAKAGMKAVFARIPEHAPNAARFCRRCGFAEGSNSTVMVDTL